LSISLDFSFTVSVSFSLCILGTFLKNYFAIHSCYLLC
jgi:hypothetical protein